jgi:polyhydroxybutyrate depolymerase
MKGNADMFNLRAMISVATVALVGLPAYTMAQIIDVGRGPVSVHVPPSYHPGTPMPLILQLHGRGGTGAGVEEIIYFAPLADEYGFLYLHPDGRVDPIYQSFWSATDACCNFYGAPDTDADYLLDLIDEMKSLYNVDADRVHIVGFSNGGFMAHRMACDHSDTLASVASFAGTTFLDPQDCQPAVPIPVLQIHGTSDSTVYFDGGVFGQANPYPGAIATIEQWATKNGCQLVADNTAPNIDLVAYLPGDDSTVTRYPYSCDPNGFAELWTIVTGTHSMMYSETFSRQVVDFLYTHPGPPPAVPMSPWGPVPLAACLLLIGAVSVIRQQIRTELEHL